jgi:two-component system LytT family response regulator
MESLDNLSPCVAGLRKIYLRTHEKCFSFSPEEILFCKAEGSYTRVVFDNCSEVLISKPLKSFQEYIPEELFVRCHASYLINVKNVKSFCSKKKVIVFMSHYVPISRRKSNKIFQILAVLGIQDIKINNQLHDFLTTYKNL